MSRRNVTKCSHIVDCAPMGYKAIWASVIPAPRSDTFCNTKRAQVTRNVTKRDQVSFYPTFHGPSPSIERGVRLGGAGNPHDIAPGGPARRDPLERLVDEGKSRVRPRRALLSALPADGPSARRAGRVAGADRAGAGRALVAVLSSEVESGGVGGESMRFFSLEHVQGSVQVQAGALHVQPPEP